MVMLLVGGFTCPARGADAAAVRPWWVMAEFGEGQLQLKSDQATGSRQATFAMGFAGGHSLGSRARIGLEVNGWLLQAFDPNDPTRGVSVSNVAIVVDAFPIRKSPFFLRGGTGVGVYQNNHPDGYGGKGWCWTAGAGYEIRLRKSFGLAPMVGYSAGSLGDVRNVLTVETGRRYSVVEFKVGIVWHLGEPKQRKDWVIPADVCA
jgi:hypothetical protein